MEYKLLSITLPKNSDAKITLMQNKLFRDFGFASAICLPVFLPLLFTGVDSGIEESVSRLTHTNSFPIECTELVEDEGFFFLKTDPSDRIRNLALEIASGLKNAVDYELGNKVQALMPVEKGIFLACNETGVELESVERSMGHLPVLRFSSFSLSLMNIEVFTEDGSPWWSDVDWEIVWEKRLPKEKAQDSSVFQ